MADYSVLKASFQYGEISPFFGGQVGSEVYAAGVRVMQNVLPDQAGGFRKRNGTIFVASPDPKLRTRLFEFYTGKDSYVLAINTNRTYLYSTTGELLCSTETPYSDFEDILDIKVRANKGVLYLVHRAYIPKTLTMTGDPPDTLAYADMTFVVYSDDAGRAADFSTAGNFPSALCFKGGRLFFAATDNHPATVWASRVPDGEDRYNDFTLYDCIYVLSTDNEVKPDKTYYSKDGQTNRFSRVAEPSGDPSANNYYERYNWDIQSSHAFELEENDMYGTSIHWLAVQNRVICGNKRAIFMDTGDISSPTTFDMTVSLNTGSAPIQAKAYKNYVLFLGSNEKQLYLMVWDDNLQNYSALEITKNASHLFKDGIADFDIMLDPDLIIWVVTKTGELLSCSMATGWASHPRGAGKYTSLAVVGESHSRLFLEVLMDGEYHFEYLDVLASDTTEGVFTDCSTVFNLSEAGMAVPVNPALKNYAVSAFADGAIMPVVTAEEDEGVVYARYLKNVTSGSVGLPIESKVQLFPPELPANGTSIGKVKKISKVTLRLYASFGGVIAVDDAAPVQILLRRYGVYRYGDGVELVSDDVSVDTMGKNTRRGEVYIWHKEPVPFNVLSVGTRFELVEG